MFVGWKIKPPFLIFQHIYIKLNKYDHTINLQYLTECSHKVCHSVTKSTHKMCKLLQSSITSQTIATCAISQAHGETICPKRQRTQLASVLKKNVSFRIIFSNRLRKKAI